MANFEVAIRVVLDHEGGFVNHVNDNGGASNYGISLRYLKKQGVIDGDFDHDGDVDIDDIRAMTREDAIALYKRDWWDKHNLGEIVSQIIATKLLDMAINMGIKQATKILQRALNDICPWLGLAVDGVMGALTLNAINITDPFKLIQKLRDLCVEFYTFLVEQNARLITFLKGWLKRARS